jgi:hypothetical protein
MRNSRHRGRTPDNRPASPDTPRLGSHRPPRYASVTSGSTIGKVEPMGMVLRRASTSFAGGCSLEIRAAAAAPGAAALGFPLVCLPLEPAQPRTTGRCR